MNGSAYIHEFVDIIGHHRANYMHHVTANWSPVAQEERDQRCFGVFAVLGSTGRWPQVCNLWEHSSWSGLAEAFAIEAVGAGAQDPTLTKWWAAASQFRSGGADRLLRPAPWSRTIEQLCADGVTGQCYAHDLITVRGGTDREYLERLHGELDRRTPPGFELAAAFSTAMANDNEVILLWAVRTWQDWAASEQDAADRARSSWQRADHDLVLSRHRILLVDAPLSPLRTHRQPCRADRTEWTE